MAHLPLHTAGTDRWTDAAGTPLGEGLVCHGSYQAGSRRRVHRGALGAGVRRQRCWAEAHGSVWQGEEEKARGGVGV